MTESVVITGIGVALPGSQNPAEMWTNLSQGKSQVDWIDRFDPALYELKTHTASQLKNFDPHTRLNDLTPKFRRKYSRG